MTPNRRGPQGPRRAFLLAAALLAAAGAGVRLGLAVPPPDVALVLEVRDATAGRLAHVVRLGPEGSFELSFTHSMYGGGVTETYHVLAAPPRLRRTLVRTEHGGAAEYYALYGNMRQAGDGWIVEAAPLEVDVLPLRVDAIGRPRIRTGELSVHLLDVLPAGHVAELRPAVIALRRTRAPG